MKCPKCQNTTYHYSKTASPHYEARYCTICNVWLVDCKDDQYIVNNPKNSSNNSSAIQWDVINKVLLDAYRNRENE